MIDAEKVQALAQNVGELLTLTHKRQETVNELLALCLKHLVYSGPPRYQTVEDQHERRQLVNALREYLTMTKGESK